MSDEYAAEAGSGPVEAFGVRRAALYALLAGLVAFYLTPLETGLLTSLKTSESFTRTIPFAPPGPSGFTLDSWSYAWNYLNASMVNSLLLAVPAAALSALLGSTAAYGLTNLDWRGEIPVVLLFIAGIFIPYQAVLVPLSRLWAIVDLARVFSLFGVEHYAYILELVITHTAYGIPITTLLFRSYYKSISEEMIEAARLDGASVYSIYRKIILPLSIPMFAVTLIYQFTQIWNDLLFALVIIPGGSGSSQAAVVTLALNDLGGSLTEQIFNRQMAGAFVAALPTLLVYIFFGEQFAEGVAAE